MSGLARILLEKKVEVTGSDIASSHVTEGLVRKGAKVTIGHSAQAISPDMTVVYSSGINKKNLEYQAALKMKCPIMHRSDLLHHLIKGEKALAVAGSHGKTTTAALLSWVLSHAGLDPSFAVGGEIPQFHSNANHGKGGYFVLEADESDGTFLKYHPYGAIVTNIGLDHLDHYGTAYELMKSFRKFMSQVQSTKHLFWCAEDTRLQNLLMPGITYGFGRDCKLSATNFRQRGWKVTFDVEFEGKEYPEVDLSLTGRHNALNGLAVFGMSLSLGIKEEKIRSALRSFGGIKRRLEKKGNVHSIMFLDDYAHHPTEIRVMLRALRDAIQERRLIAIFQPHRYTRTRDCLGSFKGIFDTVDKLVVTEVYSAGESPISGISHETILDEIKKSSTVHCQHVSRNQLVKLLSDELRPHDVVVTVGAGDITKVCPEFITTLKKKALENLKLA